MTSQESVSWWHSLFNTNPNISSHFESVHSVENSEMNKLCKHLEKDSWYIDSLLSIFREFNILKNKHLWVWFVVEMLWNYKNIAIKTESFPWSVKGLRGKEPSKTKICSTVVYKMPHYHQENHLYLDPQPSIPKESICTEYKSSFFSLRKPNCAESFDKM